MPFQAYEWAKNPSPKSMLQRLLIPLTMLIVIVLGITLCPLKWILTGTYTIDANSKWTRWLYNFMTFTLDEKF